MSRRMTPIFLALLACKSPAPAPPPLPAPEAPPAATSPAPAYGAVSRADFNRIAAQLDVPIYWSADKDGDRSIDPDEMVELRFYGTEGRWTADGRFTAAFDNLYARVRERLAGPIFPDGLDEAELARRRAVVEELDQGRPTLVHTDLSRASEQDRAFVGHMLAAAAYIDRLYARQLGLGKLAAQIPADDDASRRMFARNWGPKCRAGKTENNPACSAVPGAPKPRVDAYPAALQADDGFCKVLQARDDADALFAPFVVARPDGDGGALRTVPVTEAYKELAASVAKELLAAAAVWKDPGEAPLVAYLRAAAQAFTDNNWEPADEAWAAMSVHNSRWYLRIAPDETYWDPCSQKAGFHMTFAHINRDSLKWQGRIDPVQQEMEQVLAAAVGAPYEARKVTFHLPDFIDIIFNAGDDRGPLGATIGQSLPNWGPVANEGRGRTVAMSNLYTDADSRAVMRVKASSLLDAASMEHVSDDREPGLLATILHEAAHNLGPAHEYEVDGKTAHKVFGGPLAATLEELKAQTAALWYTDFLRSKGLITAQFAANSYVGSFVWAIGHISNGMYTPTNKPKPYAQLSAIQVGFLQDQGAVTWNPGAPAANGTDKGAFTVHLDKLPAAADAMMKHVGGIKARGDVAAAKALVAKYVDGDTVPVAIIAERIQRHTKASFVYAIDL